MERGLLLVCPSASGPATPLQRAGLHHSSLPIPTSCPWPGTHCPALDFAVSSCPVSCSVSPCFTHCCRHSTSYTPSLAREPFVAPFWLPGKPECHALALGPVRLSHLVSCSFPSSWGRPTEGKASVHRLTPREQGGGGQHLRGTEATRRTRPGHGGSLRKGPPGEARAVFPAWVFPWLPCTVLLCGETGHREWEPGWDSSSFRALTALSLQADHLVPGVSFPHLCNGCDKTHLTAGRIKLDHY